MSRRRAGCSAPCDISVWQMSSSSSRMATFVSLATCHHCPVPPSRRGLVYRDSLSGLYRNLRTSPWTQNRPAVWLLPSRPPHRPTRARLPQSSAPSHPKRACGVKQLVLTHLRRLLTLSPAHQLAG
ncbi:hypothetical protein OJAV_G00164330 [Oryzias javanicus]|uniref:Uncharacterized protein n=1 Tax=Oryzias javanicus TaxID=123683 RepID=A0A3S2PWW7_ORYJA|nr:hypothetical protein OJAV_G00164330 [Oryzias javanicus]